MTKNGSIKTSLAVAGIVITLLVAATGYGRLMGSVDVNRTDIKAVKKHCHDLAEETADIRVTVGKIETNVEWLVDDRKSKRNAP